jgi:hypothetical protein
MPQLIAGALTKFGVDAAVAKIAGNLLTSIAASLISARLGKLRGTDLSNDMAQPRSLPPYRFVYGKGVRIQGTPAPWVEHEGIRYACFLLNSRPSDGGNLKIYADKRQVTLAASGVLDFGEVQQGTVTIAEGDTQATIAHGLSEAPNGAHVGARTGTLGDEAEPLAIDLITATDFRVTLPDPAPAGGAVVRWSAALPGGGAEATNSPFAGHATFWLGRGDQGHPPATILCEFGDFAQIDTTQFWASDKMTGLTVLWCRLVRGKAKSERERWPANPPLIEVEADFTPVWDPRDEDQDPDDPTTWAVSDNQALCLLDALRFNPLARIDLSEVIVEQFAHGADVAEEVRPLLDSLSEPMWRVGGPLYFNATAELAQQLRPLIVAGAGELLRIGGRYGYRAGAWAEPALTLTDYLDSGDIGYQQTRRTRDAPKGVQAVFPDPDHGWEPGELEPVAIGGETAFEDRIQTLDLDLVPFPTQAMHLQLIEARRLALGRRFRASFPPTALPACAGATVELDLPGLGYRNGVYHVEASNPARWIDAEAGDVMELPLELAETAESVWAWDPAIHQQRRFIQGFRPLDLSLPVPTSLIGVFETDPVTEIRRLRVTFLAPGKIQTEPNDLFTPNPDIAEFALQWSEDDGEWTDAGTVAVPLPTGQFLGQARGYIWPVFGNRLYRVRVRSVADGRVSEWVEAGPYLDAPPVVATGGTVTDDNFWRVHTFTGSGDFVVTSGGLIEYVVVGGGAGGGKSSDFGASGGGAGGQVLTGFMAIEAGTHPIVIGAGGVGGDGTTFLQGEDGSETTGLGLTAAPGAGGGGATGLGLTTNLGRAGFHGGGGGARGSNLQGGTGSSGRNGGNGFNSATAAERAGGGGAGMGSAGGSAAVNAGGNGGAGIDTWAGQFGGGGGGGVRTGTPGTASHGGGAGAGTGSAGGAAAANTGGGGGGTGSGSGDGGAGAAGRVIIRYRKI